MLQVEIPTDQEKLKQQILAIEYQLLQDDNDKDREIHQQVLHELRKNLRV